MLYYSKTHSDDNELSDIIMKAQPNTVCKLPAKLYYLTRRLQICGMHDLVIDGNGTKIITHYRNDTDYTESSDAILLENCSNITLKDLSFHTDCPACISATVESVEYSSSALIIKIDDDFKVSGNEVLMAFNTMDSEATPDYMLNYYAPHPEKDIITVIQDEIVLANTYSGAKKEYLGKNRFKVFFPEWVNLSGLEKKRLCIRHTMYGPSVITIRNCDNTALHNITISGAPGMGITILPHCTNLTLSNLSIRRCENIPEMMACNCDGIHITGLGGKLIMNHCLFDNLGDDALNIHSAVATLTAYDYEKSKIICRYKKKDPDGRLSKHWCRPGDCIKTYNPINLHSLSSFTVVDFDGSCITYKNLKGNLNIGDLMENISLSADCKITECTVKNTRARAFLIQSRTADITNCTFFGIALNAIRVAPAFRRWFEAGPSNKLLINRNSFEKCSMRDNIPVICVATEHDGNDEKICGLHGSVTVEGNRFKRADGCFISISSAKHAVVRNNYSESEGTSRLQPIETVSCDKIEICDNKFK